MITLEQIVLALLGVLQVLASLLAYLAAGRLRSIEQSIKDTTERIDDRIDKVSDALHHHATDYTIHGLKN